MVVRERERVVAVFGVTHEYGDDVVGKVGDQRGVGQVFQGALEAPRVHQPQALHEDLIAMGHAGGIDEVFGPIGTAAPSTDVEQEVVYYRESVVVGEIVAGVADVLMPLAEILSGLGRVMAHSWCGTRLAKLLLIGVVGPTLPQVQCG